MSLSIEEFYNSEYFKDHPDYNCMEVHKGVHKIYNIYKVLDSIKHLDGCTAEIGVYGGMTTNTIVKVMKKQHYAYDTFKGILGSNDSYDFHKNGEFACNLDKVVNYIQDSSKINYKVGYFPDTFSESSNKFCFLHTDTDTLIGTKTSLEIFFPLLVVGGFIVVDDYKWQNCPGVEMAANNFMRANMNCIECYTIGHQLFIKKIN